MKVWRDALGLAGWVLLCLAAGVVGGLASAGAGAFYGELERPGWAPPAGIFGPVWTVLYLLMGLAAWRIWRVGGFGAARGLLVLFLVQLAANALWSWIFFVWRSGFWALVEVVLLWGLVGATLVGFWRIRRVAGLLLLPYFAWVGFAAVLTFSLWRRNPALLGG
ncbi:MAG: tryptophan-rich sensory protein [Puniceicoccaceae bacterium]|nr:MAG: tryptophan-rich sensory protein [Puniceicoccaceae bacterium]